MHRVLIIEDKPGDAEHYARILDKKNLFSTIKGRFADGLAAVREQRFSCVLLDLGLPDSGTLETARELHQFGEVPIVALTGSDDPEVVREIRRHGAVYLLKPSDGLTITERVLAAIERREPSEETERALVQTQREKSIERQPWILRWVALAAFALSLTMASATGGAFLFRYVSDKATAATEIKGRFQSLDEAMRSFKESTQQLQADSRDLQVKAQTSIEDRNGIHRELGMLMQQQTALKEDVVKRLERIEDRQEKVLTELLKRK